VKEKEKDEYPAIKRLPTERQSVVSLFVAVLLGRTCEEEVSPLSLLSFDCFRFYNRKKVFEARLYLFNTLATLLILPYQIQFSGLRRRWWWCW